LTTGLCDRRATTVGPVRIGSDTGGTFTDLVDERGRVAKVPSTPDDPARAVAAGLAGLGGRPTWLGHGTTVATNALLEGQAARTALITNVGFADVIEIGRQDRPDLYDQTARRPEPLVARVDRHEIAGRLGPAGEEIEPLVLDQLPSFPPEVEAVVVCLLHSDLDPAHERAVLEALDAGDAQVTASHQVTPEFREYERLVTTVISASLGPVCRRYLEGLVPLADRVLVLTSAGGLTTVEAAGVVAARLLLSGPAGGVAAAAAAARDAGFPDAITFDMGGTSTDVCLVEDGRAAPAAQRDVGGWPVRLPALDVHTIGAGGGSIAWIDDGGALRVGPRSAGAVPGPACYGQGGDQPTVTDADLVAGRIDPGVGFEALGTLDLEASRTALATLGLGSPESAAADVLAVVDAAMVGALRAVSVERGVDPAGLALVAFGGAGPLHACALADALGMAAVVVPPRAGVLSAVGVLTGPEAHDMVRSRVDPADHTDLGVALERLGEEARTALGPGAGEVEVRTAVDARYAGQSHELTVPDPAHFADEHRRRNGYDRPGVTIEVTAMRAGARRSAPLAPADLPVDPRSAVTGPVVVTEGDTTILVPDGWSGRPHPTGALVLERRS
jgi:N-methylhydantoinase A/oxoprolinase/acetone carboxylase beta subunit